MSKLVEIGISLICATIVATALTTGIVSIAASIDDLIWLLENGQSISHWPLDLIFSVIGTAALAVFFGFIGAALFLSIALFPLIRKGSQTLMIVAGGLAGFAHSIVGWGLRIADNCVGPLDPFEDIIRALGTWGGFILTDSGRQIVAIATVPASVIAGCVAGLTFFRVLKGRPHHEP